MSRRRDADRAEALVKGVGAIILLLLVLGLTQVLPQILKGKTPNEMISTMFHVIVAFVVFSMLVSVVGVIVWVKVRNRKGK